ncbi:lytic transglycosylase domain-containing protein [Erythrobacter sp. LQ02-29]|uniref:lytic transglycosylase domain-containing protein n=1 Tax=Erythrobacter sp. LQ02-29 TaxID=2920384 RepID=UPI001F4DD4D2|nr:lytic transglycosylase domain-containing protein [Erythrobacter sp. LQ02-29]MCP9222386.1 lytic transglycosylase domain-containing protein [Erythrobacter sp. LQ02-29]
MILAKCGGAALAVALALTANVAQADVLEIGDDGARWIAGDQAVLFEAGVSDAGMPDAGAQELSAEWGGDLPPAALSDPAAQAGGIPTAYAAKVAELARRFDLSPTLIEALVWQESRWQAGARSPVGARGLAQLMPGTAREMGVDPDDPFANLEGGARYLREQLDRFDGDLEKALAAYNAGPGRVLQANGVPRIRETQIYVAAIMGRLADHSREDD